MQFHKARRNTSWHLGSCSSPHLSCNKLSWAIFHGAAHWALCSLNHGRNLSQNIVMLCCTLLCCAILCYVVLCIACAMLCYASSGRGARCLSVPVITGILGHKLTQWTCDSGMYKKNCQAWSCWQKAFPTGSATSLALSFGVAWRKAIHACRRLVL